jgi:hypothetical protein
MFELIKKRYGQIRSGEPGMRFRSFHELRHDKTEGLPWQNWAYTAAGISLILGGFLLSIPPGVPGFLVIVVGISMIAARSHSTATFLDAIELSFRCIFTRNCPSSLN